MQVTRRLGDFTLVYVSPVNKIIIREEADDRQTGDRDVPNP